MFTFMKRIAHFENRMDDSIEKFAFQHQFLGFCMFFIGMPLATLAVVCVCTAMVTLPIAFLFGWI